MTQPIARIYGSQAVGKSAFAALQEAGFRTDDIHVITRPKSREPAEEEGPANAILEAILAAGIAPVQAAVYADAVGKGKTLVTVKPPFGGARVAIEILDGLNPIAVTVPEVEVAPPAVGFTFDSSSATPLSDAFGWKVLLNNPTPLSSYMGWSVLKKETGPSRTLDSIRKQSNDPTPFSTKLGLPVLIDNPTPLSSKAGWKTLWGTAAPLSDKLGWKTLWGSASPLSDKLGWKTLLNNPTPLSSLLGLPVLSKR
jgi:hypothetical protein